MKGRKQSRTERFLDYYERRIKEDREATFFILLTALSKDSENPQNICLPGDPGIGKSWAVSNVLEPFSSEDVLMLGGMSPTALIHDLNCGELQDANGNPMDLTKRPGLVEIKEEMQLADPHVSKGKIRKEYFDRLKKWNDRLRNSRYVIDLSGKLLVFLDAPHPRTFNMLKPILSHDVKEISYKFTDRSSRGQLRTQHVVIKGWPACIVLTSNKNRMEDFSQRNLTVTPRTSKEKWRAACILIGEEMPHHYPFNDPEEEKLKARMRLEFQSLQSEIERGKFSVFVPYGGQLGRLIPVNQARVMRDMKRIKTYIELNALVNHKDRPKLTGGERTTILATYEDFETVMHYFKYCEETTTTGLNQHILNMYHKAMVPLKKTTYSELVDKCKKVLPRPLSKSTLRVYVQQLSNVGYVSEESHQSDKRMKVLRVIKSKEEALDSVRNEFKEWFTLESFKASLKKLRKNRTEKPILLNNIPSEEWDNHIKVIFQEHFTPSEKTSLVKNGKTERFILTDSPASSAKTSPQTALKSERTESNGISITPIQGAAESCPLCGKFPVAYEFTDHDQQIRCCHHCIQKMKDSGVTFTLDR